MEYVWYIDIFFLVNFGMDFLLLKLLGKLLIIPTTLRRLAASSALGAGGSCLAFFLRYWLLIPWTWLVDPVTVILMLEIAFRPKTVRGLGKTACFFYLEAFCIGGIMEAMYHHTGGGFGILRMIRGEWMESLPLLTGIFGACAGWFGLQFLWRNLTQLRKERRYLYEICLYRGEKRIKTTGYLDSGNCLREPDTGLPVHIVAETVWNRLGVQEKEIIQIPYRTIGNPWAMMEGARIDALEIIGDRGREWRLPAVWIARAPFGLTDEGDYEVLLHKDSFGKDQEAAGDRSEGKSEGGLTDGDQGFDTEPFSVEDGTKL